MASRAPRRRRRSLRDASTSQRTGTRDRCARRTRLQQLAARRRARKCRRIAQRGTRAPGFGDRDVGARSGGAGRRRAGGRPRVAFRPLVESRLSRDPRIRIVRDEVHAIPRDRPASSPAGRFRRKRCWKTSMRCCARRARRRAVERAALLRCRFADRRRRFDRRVADVPQVAIR